MFYLVNLAAICLFLSPLSVFADANKNLEIENRVLPEDGNISIRITFGEAPGLPATLYYASAKLDASKIKLFAEVDDRLIVVQFAKQNDRYYANFPTPKSILIYRIKLEFSGGEVVYTEPEKVIAKCEIINNLPVINPKSEVRESYLAEALTLGEQIEQLKYITDSLSEYQ
jgi:hypothetical protein